MCKKTSKELVAKSYEKETFYDQTFADFLYEETFLICTVTIHLILSTFFKTVLTVYEVFSRAGGHFKN